MTTRIVAAGGGSGGEIQAKGTETAARVAAIPFTRAAVEHRERFVDDSSALTAAVQNIGPFDVAAFGYMRGIYVYVESASGAAGLNNAVSTADGPWSVLQDVTLRDVSGGPLVGPISGYDLMLINKYGGYAFDSDPVRWPTFVDVDNDGGFSFLLYIPVEIVARNAFGALPNMNAANTYKLDISLAASATVFSTAPDTLPTVRVRAWLDAWTAPQGTDPAGNAQGQRPPAVGTTQYWSKVTKNTVVGSNNVSLPRVGNFIRTLVMVVRDENGAREGADAPTDPLRLTLDSFDLFNDEMDVLRAIMARQYGYALNAITNADDDEGVFVYSFSHDFDGHPGGELGDLWLPTSQSSRLEIVGSVVNAAGTLDVLTNDVNPTKAFLATR